MECMYVCMYVCTKQEGKVSLCLIKYDAMKKFLLLN
jgi:hypothetical protein